ncbi:hypothetical protein DFJ74DRAFT_366614, partial [Hyaloraphidium curvatum]
LLRNAPAKEKLRNPPFRVFSRKNERAFIAELVCTCLPPEHRLLRHSTSQPILVRLAPLQPAAEFGAQQLRTAPARLHCAPAPSAPSLPLLQHNELRFAAWAPPQPRGPLGKEGPRRPGGAAPNFLESGLLGPGQGSFPPSPPRGPLQRRRLRRRMAPPLRRYRRRPLRRHGQREHLRRLAFLSRALDPAGARRARRGGAALGDKDPRRRSDPADRRRTAAASCYLVVIRDPCCVVVTSCLPPRCGPWPRLATPNSGPLGRVS